MLDPTFVTQMHNKELNPDITSVAALCPTCPSGFVLLVFTHQRDPELSLIIVQIFAAVVIETVW